MSDPIAEAAAHLSDAAPISREPVGNGVTDDTAAIQAQVNTGNVLVNSTPVVDSGNVVGAVQNATAPTVDSLSLAGTSASTAPVEVIPQTSELPRESHLMLLEAKIAAFRAKLANAERVALDEFESIVGHVKAVL